MQFCPSILAPLAQRAVTIGTGQAQFDAAEQRKDGGKNHGVIDTTWHVPRATAQTLAKITKSKNTSGQTN